MDEFCPWITIPIRRMCVEMTPAELEAAAANIARMFPELIRIPVDPV